jgi:ABC-type branched-subunit amino acid transport system substrate-binding protein
LEANAYDSALLLRSLIAPGTRKTRSDLRQALITTKDFEGATGKTTFNSHREAEKSLFFISLDTNGVRELGPKEKVSGS